MHQRENVHADDLVNRITANPADRGAGVVDVSLGIDERDSVAAVLHERPESLLGPAAILLGANALERIADRSHDRVPIRGSFDQVVLGSHRHGIESGLLIAVAGEDDDGDAARVFENRVESLRAAAVGQVQIEQDDVDGRERSTASASERRSTDVTSERWRAENRADQMCFDRRCLRREECVAAKGERARWQERT